MTGQQKDLESYLSCAFGQIGQNTGELIRKMILSEINIHQECILMIRQSFKIESSPPVIFEVHPDNSLPGVLTCLASDIGRNTGDFLKKYQLLKISQHQRAISELENLLTQIGSPI
jgi:hypothetical protein